MAQTGNTITLTPNWQKFMDDYLIGTYSGLKLYWRVEGRYTAITDTTITVALLGTLVIKQEGSSTGLRLGPISTVGGQVANYSVWGIPTSQIHSNEYFYVGETQMWYGYDTLQRSAGSTTGVCRFYSQPYGWTSDDLSIGGTMIFPAVNNYKLYGSVNNQTKKITKLYGSVNGQTKKITKLYGSVNGQTKRIF